MFFQPNTVLTAKQLNSIFESPTFKTRLDISTPALTASLRDDGAGNLGWYVGGSGAADGSQVKAATVDKVTGALTFAAAPTINGSPIINGADTNLGFYNGATRYGYLRGLSTGMSLVADALPLTLAATGANVVSLQTNSSERVRIDSVGNVGIGTSAPSSRLHVSLETSPNWGGGWGNWSAAFGGGSVSAGAIGLSYDDTNGGQIGAIVPGTAWKRMTIRGSGISFKPDGVNESLYIDTAGTARPGADNFFSLGSPSFRWSVVYAGTGTINTSDAREKTPVRSLLTAEIAAARDLAGEVGAYQWLASIAEKGEAGARLHIGMTVQRAIEIMESHDLDPWRYGFICRDEITRKVKVTQMQTVQATEDVEEAYTEIEIRDGVPVQAQKTRTVQRPQVQMVAVVDEAGQPVMQEVNVEIGRDAGGEPIIIRQMEPLLHPVPVMIEVEREVEIEEPDGERLGFRYDQLTVFMLRGLLVNTTPETN